MQFPSDHVTTEISNVIRNHEKALNNDYIIVPLNLSLRLSPFVQISIDNYIKTTIFPTQYEQVRIIRNTHLYGCLSPRSFQCC